MKKKSIRKVQFSRVFVFGKFYFWGENPFANSFLPTPSQRFFSDKRDFLKVLSKGFPRIFRAHLQVENFRTLGRFTSENFLFSFALTHTHSPRCGNFRPGTEDLVALGSVGERFSWLFETLPNRIMSFRSLRFSIYDFLESKVNDCEHKATNFTE